MHIIIPQGMLYYLLLRPCSAIYIYIETVPTFIGIIKYSIEKWTYFKLSNHNGLSAERNQNLINPVVARKIYTSEIWG